MTVNKKTNYNWVPWETNHIRTSGVKTQPWCLFLGFPGHSAMQLGCRTGAGRKHILVVDSMNLGKSPVSGPLCSYLYTWGAVAGGLKDLCQPWQCRTPALLEEAWLYPYWGPPLPGLYCSLPNFLPQLGPWYHGKSTGPAVRRQVFQFIHTKCCLTNTENTTWTLDLSLPHLSDGADADLSQYQQQADRIIPPGPFSFNRLWESQSQWINCYSCW